MMRSRKNFDVVVIGAGPAGLSTVQALGGTGLATLVVEEGRLCRDRDRGSPTDVPSGIGGAGLFSDGKFSFYPSATNLWSLANADNLKKAYAATCRHLAGQGLEAPPFPYIQSSGRGATDHWVLKKYPSTYLALGQRIELIEQMADCADSPILHNTKVTKVIWDSSGFFSISLHDGNSGESSSCTSRALVLSTGRFGSLGEVSGFYPTVFRRLEVGTRIRQPAQTSFFRSLPGLDPKLKLLSVSGSEEWRTFCACRDGEIVKTSSSGYWSISGRADGPGTGNSNIGFNVRITEPATADEVLPSLLPRLRQPDVLFNVPFREFLTNSAGEVDGIIRCFGPVLTRLLREGLSRLASTYPHAVSDAVLSGPTVEGVGYYPMLDHNLKVPDMDCWVAGDATGMFRGIVAAMVSGYYVGLSVASKLTG